MKCIYCIGLLYIIFGEYITNCSQRAGEGISCSVSFKNPATIIITTETPLSSVYIHYNKTSKGVLSFRSLSIPVGTHGYRHEFIPLPACSKSIRISYSSLPSINKVYCFNATPPTWVERWKPPLEEADLMIVSAHDDDTHLYFAGLIPTVKNEGRSVQVVYTISHDNNPPRYDEVLASLWVSGIQHYPILGIVPDKFSTTLEQAIKNMEESKMSIQDLIAFHLNNIRRFRPAVIVTHDERGEYGHGQHQLTSYSVRTSMLHLNDTHIANTYPLYTPFKLYVHLYPKNRIQMNYDVPLEHYGGLTAYQVSRLSFDQHVSQHSVYLTRWFGGENQSFHLATEITTFSPCEFGLYMSMVGYNDSDGDMFSNIPLANQRPKLKEFLSPVPVCSRVRGRLLEHEKALLQRFLLSLLGLSILFLLIRNARSFTQLLAMRRMLPYLFST